MSELKERYLLCDEHIRQASIPHTGLFHSDSPDDEPCLICELQSAWKQQQQLQAINQQLVEALEKLRDCDWVITLPDRMDAVREIAREALTNANQQRQQADKG
jgi:hypothetical protein